METQDAYAYAQLTKPDVNKIITDLLLKYGDGSYEKLIIIEPKKDINAEKSLETVKGLFDPDVTVIKK
jgi:hypothetical protein